MRHTKTEIPSRDEVAYRMWQAGLSFRRIMRETGVSRKEVFAIARDRAGPVTNSLTRQHQRAEAGSSKDDPELRQESRRHGAKSARSRRWRCPLCGRLNDQVQCPECGNPSPFGPESPGSR